MPNPVRVALAFLGLLFLMWLLNAFFYDAKRHEFRKSHHGAYSGDEPHYLMVVHSLLFRDTWKNLDLAPVYQSVRQGGIEAGQRARNKKLDHHTLILDPVTRSTILWTEVYHLFSPVQETPENPMGFELKKEQTVWNRPGLVERTAHPLGLPVLTALLLAPTSPTPAEVEPRMGTVILLLAWLTGIVIYLIGRDLEMSSRDAFRTSCLLCLASPWLLYAGAYFSEIAIGLMMALGTLAWTRGKPLVAGVPLIFSVALKLPFVLVPITWVLESLQRKKLRAAFILFGTSLTLGLLLIAFYYGYTGTPWLVGNTGWPGLGSRSEFLKTFLDPERGVLLFVPWVFLGFYGYFWPGTQIRQRVFTTQIALPSLAFGVLFMIYNDPGTCYGCRYWVPLLPWFALSAMLAYRRAPAWIRAAFLSAVFVSALFAITATLLAPGSWNHRFYEPLWAILTSHAL